MVQSKWKVTFDPAGTPLVLCDFGQRIGEEPVWAWSQMVQEGNRVRGTNTLWFARGNARSGFSLSVFVDYVSDKYAREGTLDWINLVNSKSLVSAPCHVEVQDGKTYVASSAVLSNVSVTRVLTAVNARVRIDFTVEASNWSPLTEE